MDFAPFVAVHGYKWNRETGLFTRQIGTLVQNPGLFQIKVNSKKAYLAMMYIPSDYEGIQWLATTKPIAHQPIAKGYIAFVLDRWAFEMFIYRLCDCGDGFYSTYECHFHRQEPVGQIALL